MHVPQPDAETIGYKRRPSRIQMDAMEYGS